MSGEFEYFMQISETLEAGCWFAVVGKEIVAKGTSGKEVFDIAKSKYPSKEPFIMKAPDNSVMLL